MLKTQLVLWTCFIILGVYFVFGKNGFVEYLDLLGIKSKYERLIRETNSTIAYYTEQTKITKESNTHIDFLIKNNLFLARDNETLFVDQEAQYKRFFVDSPKVRDINSVNSVSNLSTKK